MAWLSTSMGGKRSLLALFAALLPALANPGQLAAQADTAAAARWIRSHAHPLTAPSEARAVRYAFLDDLLDGARIVQLGESAHGVGQFGAVKADLIRHLHEKLGFDVLAFESSLLDCYAPWQPQPTEARDYMRRCAFGVWWTEEVEDLFAYALATRETPRPLHIVGFDMQFTPAAHRARPAWVRSVLAPYDGALADRIFSVDSAFVVSFEPSVPDVYDSVAAVLGAHVDDIIRSSGGSRTEVLLMELTLRSVAAFQRASAADSIEQQVQLRDRAMAENLVGLARRVYPDARIVTWGHNYHLRERNSQVAPYRYPTMGEWVARQMGSDIYTIGLYMGTGQAANNDRSLYDIPPAPAGYLDQVMMSAADGPIFIAIQDEGSGKAPPWAQRRWIVRSWGRADTELVPADQYDALIFVPLITPPHYVAAPH